MTAQAQAVQPPQWTRGVLAAASFALVAAVWISSAIFGTYILAYYGGAVPAGTLEQWNATLPALYEAHTPVASVGMGVHFLAGAILLLLGPVQLITALRRRAPVLHRWTGRLYALAAVSAGLGGLVFIALKGTVGGVAMSLAFALYGALMVLAAAQTVSHAMARRFDLHRAWAIRLFALAIGSWLYRMGYGLFFAIAGRDHPGHLPGFDGWFDHIMNWAFFLPPLVVAELFLRAQGGRASVAGRLTAGLTLSLCALFVAYATLFFTLFGWGPAIMMRFGIAAA